MKTLTETAIEPIQNFVNGQQVNTSSNRTMDVYSPLNNEVITTVTVSTKEDLDQAVACAEKAFVGWNNQTIKSRVQVLHKYKALVEENMDEFAKIISMEHGKPYNEAVAEIQKGLEVTEFAAALPQVIPGESLEVSRGVECREVRYPLGVVASISPFNFPFMVPHWTIGIAIALGNTFILKPSEQTPITALKTAEYLKKAGLPDGVFNIVNGDKEIVEAICDHPSIKAVSFVGSTKVAGIVYKRCAENLKRGLCLGGAKNHLVLMPDAHVEMSATNIAASFIGSSGQRCMAATTLVAVGDCDQIIDKLVAEAKKYIPGKNLGPVISKEAKERITRYIDNAEKNGSQLLLDGRNPQVEGNENGYYLSPTIILSKPGAAEAVEEIFGPVLTILKVETVDEAIAIQNNSEYANGAGVFTQSGAAAKYVSDKLTAGMVGINVGVPVPREPFAFGGWKNSKFGAGDITGKSSIRFWTKDKKITTKWNPEASVNWMS